VRHAAPLQGWVNTCRTLINTLCSGEWFCRGTAMGERWCGATQKSGRLFKSPCGELLLLQVGSAFAWSHTETPGRGGIPLERTARWADQSDASLHMHSNVRQAAETQAGMILGKLSHCNFCPAPAEVFSCKVTAAGTSLSTT